MSYIHSQSFDQQSASPKKTIKRSPVPSFKQLNRVKRHSEDDLQEGRTSKNGHRNTSAVVESSFTSPKKQNSGSRNGSYRKSPTSSFEQDRIQQSPTASPVKSSRKTSALARGVFELPQISSPDIVKSQHESGQATQVALALQKDRLGESLQQLIEETQLSKTAVKNREAELAQLNKRLAELRQFQEQRQNVISSLKKRNTLDKIDQERQNASSVMSSSSSPKKRKIRLVVKQPASTSERIIEAAALTTSIVITEKALCVSDLKLKLRKRREETAKRADEISEIIHSVSKTRISLLERERMEVFLDVIAQRQALDRTLLYNKIGNLLHNHSQEDILKVYNDRIAILKQDKINLAQQYQQLWAYNQKWFKKIEKKQGLAKSKNSNLASPTKKTIDKQVSEQSPSSQQQSSSASPQLRSVQEVPIKSSPQQTQDVQYKPPMTSQQRAEQLEKLKASVIESEATRAAKAAELEKYRLSSNKDIEEVQTLNDEVRSKVIALRAENEDLFRQMRIKTERIIDMPSSELVSQNPQEERRKMLEILEEDNDDGDGEEGDFVSPLNGFEFSSMNLIEGIQKRLELYRKKTEIQNNYIQTIIKDCGLPLHDASDEDNPTDTIHDKDDLPPLGINTDQQIKTLTSFDIAVGRRADDVKGDNSDDFLVLQNGKHQKKQMESLSLLLQKTSLTHTQTDTLRQEQQQQFNERQVNMLASKYESEALKEQQHGVINYEDKQIEDLNNEDPGLQKIRQHGQLSDAEKKRKADIENLVINDPNRSANKNKLNSNFVDTPRLDEQKQAIEKPVTQGNNNMPALSAEQWRQIRHHIEEEPRNGGIDSVTTPRLISQSVRQITEDNLPEDISTEQIALTTEAHGGFFDIMNAKVILDGIMEKFNYSREKSKYLELISKNQFKSFPNPALQSRKIETEITPIQAEFLKRSLQFDQNLFKGDMRQNRTNLYIQPAKQDPRGFDLSTYMSTEDFTGHSVEHYSATTNEIPELDKMIEDVKRFTRNYMMMPSPLDSSGFKISDKISFFGSPSLPMFQGQIKSTQQGVSVSKLLISTSLDLIMHEADLEAISRITNPFIQPPIASFLEKNGNNSKSEAILYRVYPPVRSSLRNYLQRNLNKISIKEKLVICLQMAMAVFACHCRKYVLGGIIDFDHISIVEIPEEKRVKIQLLQLMCRQHDREVAKKPIDSLIFLSPEAEFNRYLEYRSDVYAIAAVLYYLFTEKRIELNDERYIEDNRIPIGVRRILQVCLLENYRDRMNSAGMCIALQQLVDEQDGNALEKEIFFGLQTTPDAILGQTLEILPFESTKSVPIDKPGVVYLYHGCYFGTMNKEGKFHSKEAYVFSLDRSTNSLQAFVSDFADGLYQFSFAYNTKLETISVHQREGDRVWFADSKSNELLKTQNYKGFTMIPHELESDFINFLLGKKFKLLDDSGSIIIGGFGQCGLHGVGVKANTITKSIALGVFEDNKFSSDGIDYQQSRIYNYIPQKDFKLTDRGMCEASNSLQIGPLNAVNSAPFLRYTDAVDLTAKIIRFTNNFRMEYILLKDLVILCLQRRVEKKNKEQEDDEDGSSDPSRIIVVLNSELQLHSFLPASNGLLVSDIRQQPTSGFYFGIGLDIDSEFVYAGLFRQKQSSSQSKRQSSIILEEGFKLSAQSVQNVKSLDLKTKIRNIYQM